MPPGNGSTASDRTGTSRIGMLMATMLCVLITAGCGSTSVRTGADPTVCAVFDSLYEGSGFAPRLTIQGKATIDANQNRIRGKIQVDVDSPRHIVFEFTSSILFGSKREDFVFSLVDDTLRIIDRERGEFYEGEEAEAVLRESLEADFAVPAALALALGGHPGCDELDDLDYKLGSGGKLEFSGKHRGRSFRVVFGAGHRRIDDVSWPVFSRDGADQLEVDYRWESDAKGVVRLSEVIMHVESRRWRCKIRSSDTG
ncbi:MAG: hypothetical protein JSW50_02425 [Candidatus Latescibacterota bacterium]|nr:MAG: hypothetical protein JSW50_02425 [Candidatus Latescibacterota bacterium]